MTQIRDKPWDQPGTTDHFVMQMCFALFHSSLSNKAKLIDYQNVLVLHDLHGELLCYNESLFQRVPYKLLTTFGTASSRRCSNSLTTEFNKLSQMLKCNFGNLTPQWVPKPY